MSAPRTLLQKAREDAGLTLLETLVALTLLAMLLALLPQALKSARRAHAMAAAMEQRTDGRLTVDLVAARLAEAMPLYQRRQDGTTMLAFTGRPDSVEFVAPVADGASGGLYRIELARAPAGTGAEPGLVLRLKPFDISGRNPGIAAVEHLLPGTSGHLAIRYLADAGSGEGGRDTPWTSAWTGTERLPRFVELTLAREHRHGGEGQTADQTEGPRDRRIIVELRLRAP